MISEEHGGAGLGAFDAMLVAAEAGRVLASVPLLGHLPATAMLDAGGLDDETLRKLAAGELRAALRAGASRRRRRRPPGRWSARSGKRRTAAPEVARGDEGLATVNGTVSWVPDAPGADVLVVVGVDASGPVARAHSARAPTASPSRRRPASTTRPARSAT